MRLIHYALVWASATTIISSCNTPNKDSGATSGEAPKDILLVNRDSSVVPGDDFFDYANGAWIKANPIPADESSWTIAHLVNEELYKRKLAINEEAVKANKSSGIDQQLAAFWKAGLDTLNINKHGIAPIKPYLDKINNLQTTEDVLNLTTELMKDGIGNFFSASVYQDAKQSDKMAFYLNQGGLGLPNRDYYFNTDERTAKIRAAYPAYISKMLEQAGVPKDSSQTRSVAVLQLETNMAKASRKLEDLRDPYANYNKMSVSQLNALTPNLDWAKRLHDLNVENTDTVIVGQPEFFKTLHLLLGKTPMPVIKDYMRFQLLNDMAPYLSDELSQTRFDFYGKMIRGIEQQKPRWKRVLDAEENAIGEILGQLFVKEYFDETAKKRYSDMVEGVRQAYSLRLKKLTWMSDSTKQKAQAKLSSMTKKVGYPDKWKDFSQLKLSPDSYAQNIIQANRWWHNYEYAKLGKPVDRTEWDMTPQTYNAYYNPSNNEIVLPAGIFTVPGFKDHQLDDALVYGYAGASTIGHEITHGFDDEGRQFDAEGNLKNWWTKKDEEEFKKRAEVLVQQFNNMIVVDSMRVNGKATLGENLADLGGILLGLDAFMQTETFKKGESINGLTPLQRYFLGYALGWLGHTRHEQLAERLMTDVHSPAKQRVNGPMPNVKEFYEAFQVRPGQKMYLPDSARVNLW